MQPRRIPWRDTTDSIEAARQAAQRDERDGWKFTLHMPSYLPVMQYADNRELRARMYRAYALRASEFGEAERDNTPLIARILAPLCWGLGFVRAQFRLFSLAAALDLEDAEVVIEPDYFASDDQMFVEQVNLRPLQPKDKFSITYGTALVEEAASETELAVSIRAQDQASRTRHRNAEQEIDGAGMVPVALWKGGADAPPQWTGAWPTPLQEPWIPRSCGSLHWASCVGPKWN